MTGDDLIEQYAIKERMSDAIETGYTDEEMVAYINDGMNMMWQVLIQRGYPETIGDMTIETEITEMPERFWKITSKAPVYVRGNKLICDGDLPQNISYYKKMKALQYLSDEIDFGDSPDTDTLYDILAQIVISLAMINHGFSMETEKDLVAAVIKMLP